MILADKIMNERKRNGWSQEELAEKLGVSRQSVSKLEGDYTVNKKKTAPTLSRVATIYWLLAVAIYLGWSLPTNSWGISWVIWPVAGILYAVVIAIVKMILKAED